MTNTLRCPISNTNLDECESIFVWELTVPKVRKKYWLAPLIISIVLMVSLIVFTQGSVVAPLIYSIF